MICEICGINIKNLNNYKRHLKRHLENPESFNKVLKMVHLDHDDLFCKYCGKECKNKNSLIQHEIRCKENPNRKSFNNFANYNKSGKSWNRGLTKETDERIAKSVLAYKESLKNFNCRIGTHLSDKHKKSISNGMKKANLGNIRRHSYGRSGYYNNIWFASTYELAYYIYNINNGVNIKRCKDRFDYFYNNSYHKYTPDFYLPDEDLYIEIKGYETEKDLYKYSSVNNLKVLYFKDIEHIINYIKDLYNVKNIYDLYEKN